MKNWISVYEQLPPENQTVFLLNNKSNSIWIGCHVYIENEGWFWATSNGNNLYINANEIVAECEIDDDCEITHWHPLPKIEKL